MECSHVQLLSALDAILKHNPGSMAEAVTAAPQVDQCTANEYPPGVGLSAHIDTHSAFTGVAGSRLLCHVPKSALRPDLPAEPQRP